MEISQMQAYPDHSTFPLSIKFCSLFYAYTISYHIYNRIRKNGENIKDCRCQSCWFVGLWHLISQQLKVQLKCNFLVLNSADQDLQFHFKRNLRSWLSQRCLNGNLTYKVYCYDDTGSAVWIVQWRINSIQLWVIHNPRLSNLQTCNLIFFFANFSTCDNKKCSIFSLVVGCITNSWPTRTPSWQGSRSTVNGSRKVLQITIKKMFLSKNFLEVFIFVSEYETQKYVILTYSIVYFCFPTRCQERGHFARDCPQGGDGRGGLRDMSNVQCYRCQDYGHFSRDCPEDSSWVAPMLLRISPK